MTTNYDLVKEEDKSFDVNYIYYHQYSWNGVSNQNIVFVYLGIRPVDEPSFIQLYETYDLDGIKEIHQHKSDPKLIEQLVNSITGQRGVNRQ